MLLQHNKMQPQTAHATAQQLMDQYSECLPHPIYSPNLTSHNYHASVPLKAALGGKRLEIKEAVHR